jgi:hypothetical protein
MEFAGVLTVIGLVGGMGETHPPLPPSGFRLTILVWRTIGYFGNRPLVRT